ncbi:MAG: hypothetical protein J0I42_20235 [Bosea sp.]|uniref:hypothetical protein n=1 Tax=Bosea sp. (in: a-proteobacteria) TaxID=1871050 RepID=UPI001ACF1587|nr:hypothetical protein [Bosea sp. (in: a-proteobacteria)]MBN9454272.1 hypothetical protein [Bosea sp. (in: a-proteobacteria)]
MQAEDAGQSAERQRPDQVAWDYIDQRLDGVSARVDRITLAAHEAGHAVVGYYVGNRVPADCEVWINARGKGEATLRGGTPWAKVVAALAGDAAVAVLIPDSSLFAGSIGEEELRTRADSTIREHSRWQEQGGESQAEDDEDIALALIVQTLPWAECAAVMAMFRDAEAEALRIARIPAVRNAIETVMLALLHHERLTGADVERLIVSAGEGGRIQ